MATSTQATHVVSSLNSKLPILFAYIGWALRYDGTEGVQGGHRYLQEHPFDNSESQAFIADSNGIYSCGVGRGSIQNRIHVIFVAPDPDEGCKKVVGFYANASVKLQQTVDGPSHFAFAYSAQAICLPPAERPKLKGWSRGQGQRRWATHDKRPWDVDQELLTEFEELKAGWLDQLPTPMPDPDEDQGFADLTLLDGKRQVSLRSHRSYESKLRQAKLRVALSTGGTLRCEVPGCGFDFYETYGEIGLGYAHVHHLKPQAGKPAQGSPTSVADLAIVCANCHAMIHRNGKCRELSTLLSNT